MKKKKPTRIRRPRKIAVTTDAIRSRARYVCDLLFGGRVSTMASAIEVEHKHFRSCLLYYSRFTAAMVAQIVAKTPVRAEWLLCGTGPVLRSEQPESSPAVHLPSRLRTVQPMFPANQIATPVLHSVVAPSTPAFEPGGPYGPEHIAAAKAIAAARGASKAVYVLVGAQALYCGARSIINQWLAAGYVTGLGLTSAASRLEVPPTNTCDHNHVARLGANAGFGLGESLNIWGHLVQDSVIRRAHELTIPVVIHTVFGEAEEHFRPSMHGAELGACIGATAYVDNLIFAEQIRRGAGQPTGVFISLAADANAAELYLAACQACRAAEPAFRGPAFVHIGAALSPVLEHRLRISGSPVYPISGDEALEAEKLLRACTAVFDGTVT